MTIHCYIVTTYSCIHKQWLSDQYLNQLYVPDTPTYLYRFAYINFSNLFFLTSTLESRGDILLVSCCLAVTRVRTMCVCVCERVYVRMTVRIFSLLSCFSLVVTFSWVVLWHSPWFSSGFILLCTMKINKKKNNNKKQNKETRTSSSPQNTTSLSLKIYNFFLCYKNSVFALMLIMKCNCYYSVFNNSLSLPVPSLWQASFFFSWLYTIDSVRAM